MNRRVLIPLLAIVLIALAVATLAAGDAIWIVPALVLLGIIGVMALAEFGLKKRLERRHDGDLGAAQADSSDPIPSTHLAKDEQTPLGDTSEAHDEISPHDLPKDHPGRREAERQAAEPR
jgi:hypothetical protein